MPRKVSNHRKSTQNTRIRLAARRRKQKQILLAISLLLFAIFIGAFLYLVHLPRFSIQTISVSGEYIVPASDIKESVSKQLDASGFQLIPRNMIFAYPKDAIEDVLLEEFPRLYSAEVSRDSLFGVDLHIKVSERVAYGVWCRGEDCFLIDAKGFIFAPADAFAEYVIFRGGMNSSSPIAKRFFPEHIDDLRVLLLDLSKNGFDAHIVNVIDDAEVDIEFLDGLRIQISFDDGSIDIISTLLAALESETLNGRRGDLEYIDLRFGNRVYFKFRE